MYIQPNTTVRIMKNVPLDNMYNDTVYFEDALAQYQAFIQFPSKTFSNQYYQRVNKNTIRLQVKADEIYDYNYMMFQNTSYSNKWFYAFITRIDYINDNTTEIVYEIDVMQTWNNYYVLEESFVEREHSATDTTDSNLVPEQLDLGQIKCSKVEKTNWFDNYVVVVATAISEETHDENSYKGGIYNGVNYTFFNINSPTQAIEVNNYIKTCLTARIDIVSIFYVPTEFYSVSASEPRSHEKTITRPTTVDGYTPRNNKLLSYPFSFLAVDTLNDCKNYRYDLFDISGSYKFKAYCSISPSSDVIVYPIDYNGSNPNHVVDLNSLNPTESITLTGFPQCMWNESSMANWFSNNASGQFIGLAGSGAVAGLGLATSSYTKLAVGGMGFVSQLNNMLLDATQSAKTRGTQGSITDVATRQKGIYFKHMCITREYAKLFDDYFDRYGYATERIKIPNRNVRETWTYTKTQNVSLKGQAPIDDISKIKQIYNNGITFWRNITQVGDYSLSNLPI